ncbi:MAG: hypothetical protein KGM42_05795 [Hyphomicrobiales bacterium]|nr:hypothetical protein [Hyphomicrobiales bacterium]
MKDERAQASVAAAWLIVANKPFYPLYVWWIAGRDAAFAATPTMAGAIFYLAVPVIARRADFLARVALVCVALVDTLFATKLFGAAAGTEAFLFPCALLAFVCFSPRDHISRRVLVALVFVAFLALHGRYGAALNGWPPQTAAKLLELDLYSAAALTAFLVWRFSRI